MFVEPSASFWSSWCFLWTLLTPGMRAGLGGWRREIRSVGMQVGILNWRGFVLAGQKSAEYHVLLCKHIPVWYCTAFMSHYCKHLELITRVAFFSLNKMQNILGLWLAALTAIINLSSLQCECRASSLVLFSSNFVLSPCWLRRSVMSVIVAAVQQCALAHC